MKYKNDRDVPGFYLTSESTQDGILLDFFSSLKKLIMAKLEAILCILPSLRRLFDNKCRGII